MGHTDEGYLSDDLLKWRDVKRAKYPDHFQLVADINRSLQLVFPLTTTLKLTIDNLLVSGLYLRGVQSYQGSALMAQRGMITEATTLTRSTIETLFYLRAARISPEFRERFGKVHVRSTNKVVRNHISELERRPEFAAEKDSAPAESLKETLEIVKEQGIEPEDLKILNVAQMAGLESTYKTDYAFYSIIAHPSVTALEQYWAKSDPMARPTGVVWGPDIGEPDALTDALLQTAMSGLHLLNEMDELLPGHGIGERLKQHAAVQRKLLDDESVSSR